MKYLLGMLLLVLMTLPVQASRVACNDRGCNDWGRRMEPTRSYHRLKIARTHRNVHINLKHIRQTSAIKATEVSHGGGLVTIPTAAGFSITVAKSVADRFTGFIADIVAAGYKPRAIGCYARGGHIRHSNHYWGGACDFDQRARDRTASAMYHVRDLAAKHGLTDGCSWGYRDCGHIEFSRAYARYAPHRHRHRTQYARLR